MSGGSLRHLLLRRFDDGELDARSAKGEGLLGGPPTTRNSDGSDSASASLGRPPWAEARELRLSLGGGMGDGDDMAGCGEAVRGRSEERGGRGGGRSGQWQRLQSAGDERYKRASRNGGMLPKQKGSMWSICVAPALYRAETWSQHPSAPWPGPGAVTGPGSACRQQAERRQPPRSSAVALSHNTRPCRPIRHSCSCSPITSSSRC